MKTKHITLIAAFLLLLTGCTKKHIVDVRKLDVNNDSEIITRIIESNEPGIPLPEGSVVSRNGNESYTITLPKGYTYVVKSLEDRSISEQPVIVVTCTCSKGNGCDPATYNGGFYCVLKDECLSCDKSTTVQERGKTQEVEILGLINRNVGFTLLCKESVPENEIGAHLIRGTEVIHGNAFEELFEIEDVVEMFRIIAEAKEKANVEFNTVIYINIFGNVAAIPMYIEEDEPIYYDGHKEYFAITVEPGKKPECICNDNERGGTCELKSVYIPLLGSGYICVSDNCNSCSMILQGKE